MRGKPLAIPLPHISGTDAAGEVTAVGDDVKISKLVTELFLMEICLVEFVSACTSGREYDCKQRTIWGFETGPLGRLL